MAGIDIGGEELLMAYLLNEKGAGIDLALSHHPSGRALSNLSEVMHVQENVLHHMGGDIGVARSLRKPENAVFSSLFVNNEGLWQRNPKVWSFTR